MLILSPISKGKENKLHIKHKGERSSSEYCAATSVDETPGYPLVNSYITNWKIKIVLRGNPLFRLGHFS